MMTVDNPEMTINPDNPEITINPDKPEIINPDTNTNYLTDYFDQLQTVHRTVYVFPIAATPWGPDGCPFNRFDTVRLNLKVYDEFTGNISVTCCGTASAVYANQSASLQYHS